MKENVMFYSLEPIVRAGSVLVMFFFSVTVTPSSRCLLKSFDGAKALVPRNHPNPLQVPLLSIPLLIFG